MLSATSPHICLCPVAVSIAKQSYISQTIVSKAFLLGNDPGTRSGQELRQYQLTLVSVRVITQPISASLHKDQQRAANFRFYKGLNGILSGSFDASIAAHLRWPGPATVDDAAIESSS